MTDTDGLDIYSDSDEELRLKSQIIANMAEGIFLARISDLTIVYANPKCEEMFGFNRGEMVGVHTKTLNVPSIDHEALAKKAFQEMAQNGLWTGELHNVRKDGTKFWSLATGSTFEHHKFGKVFLAVSTDITKAKEAELAKASHTYYLECMSRMSAVFEQPIDADQMLKEALEEVFAIFKTNRAWLLYPCDPDAPSFKVPYEVTSPEYPRGLELDKEVPMFDVSAEMCRKVLATKGPRAFTHDTSKLPADHPDRKMIEGFSIKSEMHIALRPDVGKPWLMGLHQCSGERHWTEEEQKLFKDISQNISSTLTNRLLLKEVRESEERFRKIFEYSNDPIFIVDPFSDKIVEASPKACEMLEYSHKELLSTPMSVIHQYEIEKLGDFVKAVFKDGNSWTDDLHCLKKGGEVLLTEISASIVEIEGKELMIAVVRDVTERKKTEQEVSILTTTVSMMLDSVFIFRPDSLVFFYVNDRAVEEVGYTREELFGMTPLDIKPEFSEKQFREITDKLISGPKHSTTFETMHKRKDGKLLLVEIALQYIAPPNEAPRFNVIARDITDRKKTEAALIESEQKFRDLFESSCDAIMLLDDKEFFDCNDATLKIFGFGSREEFLGKHPSEVSPETQSDGRSSREAADEKIATALKDGVNVFEWTHLRADGREFLAEVSLSEVNVKGVNALQAIVRDISKRKKAEDKLRESEEKHRMLIESGLLIAWELTLPSWQFIYVSPQAEKLLGYSQDEWYQPMFWIDHIYQDDKKWAEEYCKSCTAKGEDHSLEYRMITKNGEILWFKDLVTVVKDQNGAAVGLRGFLIDITVRKKAEERLKTSNTERGEVLKELKRMLEVSAELTEEAQKARYEAEEATKLKDKFVSLVSHDLKAPLSTMIGFLQLLNHEVTEPLNEGAKSILDSAIKSGKNMAHLIDELLGIGRLKTGKMTPKFSFIDAHYLAVRAISDFQLMAEKKDIKLINNIKDGSRIYADSTLLYEVLQNLVSNSVKFCKEGDSITISTDSDKHTCIVISDTGVGIKEEFIETIFSYEEKTSTLGTEGETGTGFGLPLSKDIVEAHGGSLEVKSTLGEGASFSITLPFVKPRVLIVEDEEATRSLLQAYLEQFDVDMLTAEDGKDALEKIKEQRPHLILTDINMPRLDGYKLIEAIRGNSELELLPIIVITSNNDVGVREKVLMLGANDFIKKPIDMSEFIPRVRRFIS